MLKLYYSIGNSIDEEYVTFRFYSNITLFLFETIISLTFLKSRTIDRTK